MIFEILLFTLAGCALGVLTGLTPGLHINTIAVIIVSVSGILERFNPILIISLIVSMAVVHSFLDFIPSILLGAPDEDSVLSVLPGHTLLLRGDAVEAIKLTAVGSLFSLLIIVSSLVGLIFTLPKIYAVSRAWIKFALVFLVLLGIFLEKKPLKAIYVFAISGIFGFLLLNNYFNFNVIFPAISGLFGVSTLLLSLNNEVEIPEQDNKKISIDFLRILKHASLGALAGMIVGVLPGIGSAQATYFLQQTTKADEKEFLVSISGVNTANIIMTLFVLYTIGKTRSGIAIAAKSLLATPTHLEILSIVGVILVSGGIATVLHLKIGVYIARRIGGLSLELYKELNLGIILLIAMLVYFSCGLAGIYILIIGTFIGILPPLIGVRRSQCMGFFILPVLAYYFSVSAIILNWLY